MSPSNNGFLPSSNGHAYRTKSGQRNLLNVLFDWIATMEVAEGQRHLVVDGNSLNLPMVALIARSHRARVELTESGHVKKAVLTSRKVVLDKLQSNKTVYGVSTGVGGSSGTRTNDFLAMGQALLEPLYIGVLADPETQNALIPLSDQTDACMPEPWVRGAILIRANSLIRGHSGVRWDVIERLCTLICENITPVVPLRGSISASGDLSPLSYVVGTLCGNPSIRALVGDRDGENKRKAVPADAALKMRDVQPLTYLPKEQIAILNGTAFSASLASLVLVDAVQLAMLAQICTAMGTEALLGSAGSHVPFVHDVTRPHPGQIEAAANILHLLEGSKFALPPPSDDPAVDNDAGALLNDRYALRTSPQILGPQMEDILSAVDTVTIECNSTTDNPLVENATGTIHNGGNFQAMAVSNAMEKTRHGLFHMAKLLFAQCTEMMNPAMNRGLPPSLASTDPSLNFHCKGLDVAMAAYVSEIGFLASPVSTHVQSAEMHNQSVNSLALISGRATLSAIDALSMLIASYLYALCQALDLRALLAEFNAEVVNILNDEVSTRFTNFASSDVLSAFSTRLRASVATSMQATSTMDVEARMAKITSGLTPLIVKLLSSHPSQGTDCLTTINDMQSSLAKKLASSYRALQERFLLNPQTPAPASPYLGRTRVMYEFVRVKLGVVMHGRNNYHKFAGEGEAQIPTIGQDVSRIYQSIRDGKMSSAFAEMFA